MRICYFRDHFLASLLTVASLRRSIFSRNIPDNLIVFLNLREIMKIICDNFTFQLGGGLILFQIGLSRTLGLATTERGLLLVALDRGRCLVEIFFGFLLELFIF